MSSTCLAATRTVPVCAGGGELVGFRLVGGSRVRCFLLRREKGVLVARVVEPVIATNVVVGLGIFELGDARVEDLLQAAPALRHGQRGPSVRVRVHSRVHVGKVFTKSVGPARAIPAHSVHAGRAPVILGLVSIHPHGVGVSVQQREQRVLVRVAGRVRGSDDLEARELLIGAKVRDEVQAIRRGSPADDVDNSDPLQAGGRVDDWRAVGSQARDEPRGLVQIENRFGELQKRFRWSTV